MAQLSSIEKNKLEKLFRMSSGYVLHFSDASFGEFFGDFDVEIHNEKFRGSGTSKANKLREFWKLESDVLVGDVILKMVENFAGGWPEATPELMAQCKAIGERLLAGKVNLANLKATAKTFDLTYMERQLARMEKAVEHDPDLAIGTAKELVETCCKTILMNLGVSYDEKNDDLPKLVKITLGHLNLLPDQIDASNEGADILKRILGNLGSVAQGIAELRNKFGTGHGKQGQASGLKPRHARLAVSSTSALVHFLFETHSDRKL